MLVYTTEVPLVLALIWSGSTTGRQFSPPLSAFVLYAVQTRGLTSPRQQTALVWTRYGPDLVAIWTEAKAQGLTNPRQQIHGADLLLLLLLCGPAFLTEASVPDGSQRSALRHVARWSAGRRAGGRTAAVGATHSEALVRQKDLQMIY